MKRLPASLREFYDKQELLRLAYVDGGHPRVIPVWFVVIGRDTYIGTYANSPKWKAIKRKPRVGWVIDGGEMGKYRGISMFGAAEEIPDAKLRARIYRALGMKYFGAADHPKHIEIWGDVDDSSVVYIRLKADDGSWWQY